MQQVEQNVSPYICLKWKFTIALSIIVNEFIILEIEIGLNYALFKVGMNVALNISGDKNGYFKQL